MANNTRSQAPNAQVFLDMLAGNVDIEAALDGDFTLDKLRQIQNSYQADPSSLPPRNTTQQPASQNSVAQVPVQDVPVYKLRKEATTIADTLEFGVKFQNKKLNKHSVLADVFMFFMCLVTVLHELDIGNGHVFSVLDFVVGSFPSQTYTATVWAVIESLCRKFVHEGSRTINDARQTIRTLRISAKLHTKQQRIILLRDLQSAAKKDPF